MPPRFSPLAIASLCALLLASAPLSASTRAEQNARLRQLDEKVQELKAEARRARQNDNDDDDDDHDVEIIYEP